MNLKNLSKASSKTPELPQNLDLSVFADVVRQCGKLKLSLIKRNLDLLAGIELAGCC